MKKRFLCLMLCSFSAALFTAFGEDASIPVAPIVPTEFRGITNAIVLQNDSVIVAVHPTLGRLVFLGFQGLENLLRNDDDLIKKETSNSSDWQNYGGGWLWPMAQNRWKEFFGKEWPPAPAIDHLAWHAQAWESEDGTKNCLLTVTIKDSLFIHIRRLIQLPPNKSSITIQQRIERFKSSRVPVTLWNIFQINEAARIAMPLEKDSRFEHGYKRLAFEPPPERALADCEGVLVFDAELGTEHKLGADSQRSWIAAQKSKASIVLRASQSGKDFAFPDDGCRVEMYSNRGLGYTEIETLGGEKVLAIGETLENTLQLDLFMTPANLDACLWATFLRQRLGEIPVPVPPTNP